MDYVDLKTKMKMNDFLTQDKEVVCKRKTCREHQTNFNFHI